MKLDHRPEPPADRAAAPGTPPTDSTESNKACWGLLRRRQCLVPALRAWFLLALGAAVLGLIALRAVYPFLAVTDSIAGGVLVVEGWSPDRVLNLAVAEYRQNAYTKLYVTGLPVEQGTFLTPFTNYAHVGAATLLKLGLGPDDVQAVPCDKVRRDRTYHTALRLKHFLRNHGATSGRVNLITVGPHARRSRLLFEKAFGKPTQVGIIAAPAADYDAQSWWKCSAGVRTVIGEVIAYAYARLLFHPPDE